MPSNTVLPMLAASPPLSGRGPVASALVSDVALKVPLAPSGQNETDEVIHDEDAGRAGDHGGVDGATYARCPAGDRSAERAAGEPDGDAENGALHEPIGHIGDPHEVRREPVVERD